MDVRFEDAYITFDTETTGKDPNTDRIVQLAFLKQDNTGEIVTKTFYFNPCMKRELQLDAYKIHKISPDFLLGKKPFSKHAEEILSFLDVKFLVGHNVLFDWNFLYNEFKRLGKPSHDGQGWLERLISKNFLLIDTYKMSLAAYPSLYSCRLQNVAKHLNIKIETESRKKYGISSPSKKRSIEIKTKKDDTSFHDAMFDTLVTNEVFTTSVSKLVPRTPNKLVPRTQKTENISIHDIPRQYTIAISDVIMLDKYLQGDANTEEITRLKDMALHTMSTLPSTRRKLVKDLSVTALQNDVNFFTKSDDINDQRNKALRELVLKELLTEKLETKNEKRKNEAHETVDKYYPQKKARPMV
ncbi:DNA polymerase III subunit epsilon-like [Hydractinia symbiolongicarpus]|uniref:DNA polymerase III subunit epsilon-like n=1 Tax=Hydractinia symbiolongicarpus TaxID=13093 RepID=UPI00254A5A42|nr:DNA polymerase III subunit epsilon-like [Hydractinia symbiolongicarpus]